MKGEIWIALRFNVGLADWRSLENEIFKEFNVFFSLLLCILGYYIGIIFGIGFNGKLLRKLFYVNVIISNFIILIFVWFLKI